MGLGPSNPTKLKRMLRSRVFYSSESDGPGTVKAYKIHENATRVQRECHGKCNESATGMPREYHESATGVPRECHESAMRVPRECHESAT